MGKESIHSKSEFYLYPEEQDKENDERSGNLNILVDEENNDNNNLDEIQEFIEQQRPLNTTKVTTYYLNVWKRYCDIVLESRKLEEIPANELNIMNWEFLLIFRGKINTLFTGVTRSGAASGCFQELGHSFSLTEPGR